MTTEWTDLPDLQAVAKAQADGWEIEHYNHPGDYWNVWPQRGWNIQGKYRARPRQPKMKKVKMLCWFDGFGLFWRKESMNYDKHWIRVPAEDKVIEVPESQ